MKISRTEIYLEPADVGQMLQTPQGIQALALLGGQAHALPPASPEAIPCPFPPMGTEANPRPIPQPIEIVRPRPNLRLILGRGMALLGGLGTGTFLVWVMLSLPPGVSESVSPIEGSLPSGLPSLPITEVPTTPAQAVPQDAPVANQEEVPDVVESATPSPPPVNSSVQIPCVFCANQ